MTTSMVNALLPRSICLTLHLILIYVHGWPYDAVLLSAGLSWHSHSIVACSNAHCIVELA